MTKLAFAISKEEGFGVPGVIPTIRHNPGDLRHGPHQQHPGGPSHANDVGTDASDADGWADLERQLVLYAGMGLTLRQMVYVYLGVPKNATPAQVAAAPDHNHVNVYLRGICTRMQMPPETLVSVALKQLL